MAAKPPTEPSDAPNHQVRPTRSAPDTSRRKQALSAIGLAGALAFVMSPSFVVNLIASLVSGVILDFIQSLRQS